MPSSQLATRFLSFCSFHVVAGPATQDVKQFRGEKKRDVLFTAFSLINNLERLFNPSLCQVSVLTSKEWVGRIEDLRFFKPSLGPTFWTSKPSNFSPGAISGKSSTVVESAVGTADVSRLTR